MGVSTTESGPDGLRNVVTFRSPDAVAAGVDLALDHGNLLFEGANQQPRYRLAPTCLRLQLALEVSVDLVVSVALQDRCETVQHAQHCVHHRATVLKARWIRRRYTVLDMLDPLVDLDPTGGLAEVQTTFRLFVNAIPTVASSVPEAPLLDVTGLAATRSSRHDGGTVHATAGVSITSLELLGGLLDIRSLTSSATASTTGLPGAATAVANPVLARVTFGMGLVGVRLDPDGLGLNLPGLPPELAGALDDALTQVQDALDTLLDALGVTVDIVEPVQETAADGSAADASGGALVVTLQPPGLDEPLMTLRLGQAAASVSVAAASGSPEPATQPQPSLQARTDTLPSTGVPSERNSTRAPNRPRRRPSRPDSVPSSSCSPSSTRGIESSPTGSSFPRW